MFANPCSSNLVDIFMGLGSALCILGRRIRLPGYPVEPHDLDQMTVRRGEKKGGQVAAFLREYT
jgi:hypothetical protein